MTEVISVRFRGGTKDYFFDPRALRVEPGADVIVETAQGAEFAVCTAGSHEVEDSAVVKPLCPVLRLATDSDRKTLEYNQKREEEAFETCQKKIAAHGLEMKLVNVSCNFDGNKIIFFFTADGRVDFRELVKDLASIFRARIELRQIGVRDEAKMLGGLGICGRPFCCAQFLENFLPVSIKMAKTQSLSLNPAKISGTCGRLMCCLKYEQDAYEDAVRRMPKQESFVQTPDGTGNVSSINLLKETVKVSLDSPGEGQHCYHNCEVCVLRNGKGSRDGIPVPAQRPERYAEPIEGAQELFRPVTSPFSEEEIEESPSRERIAPPPIEERRKSRRGGRGGARRIGASGGGQAPTPGGQPLPGGQPSPGAKPSPGGQPSRGAKPSPGGQPSRGAKPSPGGQPSQGAKPSQGGQSSPGGQSSQGAKPSQGGQSSPGAKPSQGGQSALGANFFDGLQPSQGLRPTPAGKVPPNQRFAAPAGAADGAATQESARRRSHHRGGRHRGHGGDGGTPKAE